MSQTSIHTWQPAPLTTYDCPICVTTDTNQLIQLPCGHNLCLTCLHMICAHSTLACPFCRRRLSIWLRYNPDYSKLIIKRDSTSDIEQKVIAKRSHRASKSRPAGVLHQDWLLARQIHYDQLEEFRYTNGRITRSMAKKVTHIMLY